jgi:hypothetical protein
MDGTRSSEAFSVRTDRYDLSFRASATLSLISFGDTIPGRYDSRTSDVTAKA